MAHVAEPSPKPKRWTGGNVKNGDRGCEELRGVWTAESQAALVDVFDAQGVSDETPFEFRDGIGGL